MSTRGYLISLTVTKIRVHYRSLNIWANAQSLHGLPTLTSNVWVNWVFQSVKMETAKLIASLVIFARFFVVGFFSKLFFSGLPSECQTYFVLVPNCLQKYQQTILVGKYLSELWLLAYAYPTKYASGEDCANA